MRAILIVGASESLPTWQGEALREAMQGGLQIAGILHCLNDAPRQVRLGTIGYYLLATTARLRNSMTQEVAISELVPRRVPRLRFESEWEGSWQRIPEGIIERLPQSDVAVKLGMGLLRDPQELPFRHGVVSYHHGEPETYRGRPAVFHEFCAGEPVVGVIVQRLSNTLDGGEVLARGYSRVVPYSYRRTLEELYATGVPLLAQSLRALKRGTGKGVNVLGPNRTLPSNPTVARAAVRLLSAGGRRLVYGAFREKRWRVAQLTPSVADRDASLLDQLRRLNARSWIVLPVPSGSTFVADPAGAPDGRIYCEALRSLSGRGVISSYAQEGWVDVPIPVGSAHLSYPQVVSHAGASYIFPEMAQAGSPTLFRLNSSGLSIDTAIALVGLEGERLLDGTLYSDGDSWYLFGSRAGEPPSRLDLWTAASIFGPWAQHPESPVCLDPRRARMAGPLVMRDGHLYRFGQDGAVGYGRGVAVNRITRLSDRDYEEKPLGEVALSGVVGPHTILFESHNVWFDFYTERWTPLAGLRRLKARLSR